MLLIALGTCKIWFLNNINDVPQGAGKVKGNTMKKELRISKRFGFAVLFDTIHGLGISILAATLP